MFHKIFVKITGKHVLWSLIFNNFSVLLPAALLKKRPQHSFFPLNIGNFRNTYFAEHLRTFASEEDQN